MTLLADQFMAWSKRDLVKLIKSQGNYVPPEGIEVEYADHVQIQRYLPDAQKFVIGDDLAPLLQGVCNSRPSSILAATEFARPPFSLMWFEWKASLSRIYIPDPNSPLRIPERVGVLIRADKVRPLAGMMWLVWSFEDGICKTARGVAFFDYEPGANPRKNLQKSAFPDMPFERRKLSLENLRETGQLYKYIVSDQKEYDAALSLEEHYLLVPGLSLARTAFQIEQATKGSSQKFIMDVLKDAAGDWQGEANFIQAALIIMNTKNGTDTEPVDLRSTNKKRRSEGHRPLFEHKVLRLSLRHRQRWQSQGGGDRAPMRAHLVRGHFKVRRTGVFWWSSYARGSAAEGVIEKDYVMAP